VANVAAIIGLSGRFPGEPTIENLENLWRSLGDEAAAHASGTAGSPAEPWISRTRLFADAGKAALENAACTSRLDAGRTGFFAGGAEGDTLAAEVAGELGLEGPAVTVQPPETSPAFAAVERACQSLSFGECDLALAGEKAVRGEGTGVVVLKRLPDALADGDRILGVLRGTAVQTLLPPPPAVPRGATTSPTSGEPKPVRERPALGNAYAAPSNRLESAIAGLWQEELGIDRVGVDDNFFELGGTSIAGVQIIALLKDWLHQDIPTVSLYEGPTVSALSKVLLHSGPPKGYDAVRERGERRRRKLQRLSQGAGKQDSAE
jgi:acyl carrier protein